MSQWTSVFVHRHLSSLYERLRSRDLPSEDGSVQNSTISNFPLAPSSQFMELALLRIVLQRQLWLVLAILLVAELCDFMSIL